ncbi:MAG: hypothetical protein K0R38_4364 [Polyangiaceae bacterium]|nr:hypothetical protein [Polyangiaceae bacterium]
MLLVGCSSGGELPPERPDQAPAAELPAGTVRLPFLVDDYFVPNGCFGDGDCQGGVLQLENAGCAEPDARVQGSCRVFVYSPLAAGTPGYRGYLGILFQDAANGDQSIGRVAPLRVQTGARRVVFWAKVDTGSVEVAFRAGGANNWEGETDPSLPYKDEFGVPMDVTVTTELTQIEIDLTEIEYERVVSPFGWAIVTRGRTAPIRLSIADVRWE